MEGMKQVKNLHVTLLYQGRQPHDRSSFYEGLKGREVTLEVQYLETDNKALAWRVGGDFVSENPIPHITMATRNCTPVHSNQMLALPAEQQTLYALPAPLELKGIVTSHA
jgi:hypothetical protein